MDESFSDFQEKKNKNTGPKNKQKVNSKVNKRKPLNKSRNQKDIRTLLKGKENELVSYSKNFHEVCKKSSLDVDSEQLQLAVALSKSLQDGQPSTDTNNSREEKPLSSKERTAKIRLTLQEYGFKVPSIKINNNKKRRVNKQYKLLLISDEERKTNVLNKYKEILRTNDHNLPINIQSHKQLSELYYKATNIPFEILKNDEIFYIKDLNLETCHNISLLRDWADIPGRPLSPTFEVDNFNFNYINCSEVELDIILGGTIKIAQEIIKTKVVQVKTREKMGVHDEVICIDDDEEVLKITKNSTNFKNTLEAPLQTTSNLLSIQRSISPDLFDDDTTIVETVTTNKNTEVTFIKKENQTCFMDLTECVQVAHVDLNDLKSQEDNVSKRNSNDFMDITECVPGAKHSSTEFSYVKKGSIVCNDNTANKTDSDKALNLDVVPEIEINESKEDSFSSKTTIIIEDIENSTIFKKTSFTQNKTAELSKANELHIANLNNFEVQVTPDEDHSNIYDCDNFDNSSPDVDLNRSPFSDNNDITKDVGVNNLENRHLCTSSNNNKNCNDNLKTIQIVSKKENEKPQNSKIYENTNTEIDSFSAITQIKLQADMAEFSNISKEKFTNESSVQTFESTHRESNVTMSNTESNTSNVCPVENYTDYVFEHSYIYDYDDCDKNDIANDNENLNINETVSIDYTETSKSDREVEELIKNNMSKPNYSKYHSCDELSKGLEVPFELKRFEVISDTLHKIDSEENRLKTDVVSESDRNMSEEKIENVNPDNYSDYVFEHSYIYDCDDDNIAIDKDNDFANEIHLNRTSDVDSSKKYEIRNDLGKKDDISIDYDDIIVMENASQVQKAEYSNCSKNSQAFDLSDKEFNYSLHQSRFDNYEADGFGDIEKESRKSTLNRSMSEGDIRKSPNNIKYERDIPKNVTPVKALTQDVKITPNNDYIIKTHNVTPMADYTAMSSPERNEELKKYGLKPFKRKRAIKLLTYLYNQTHPVVESCELQEISSPAKKLKYDIPTQKSPAKSLNESQNSTSPMKTDLVNISENSLYMQTKDLPDIREVYCEPEDWVFQTREKSKVHSCRVPLHIAFHNYVSCRKYFRESILRYEPVNIDVIHKQLVYTGYRYNPKDLLKFMDKKCITVKTTDNNSRNKR